MFTRPGDLADRTLASLLADEWGIAPVSLAYVAVGFGSHHWLVDDDDRRWFVTVDDLEAKKRSLDDPRDAVFDRLRAALSAACAVADRGLDFVVAPIRSRNGAVLRQVDGRYAAALYPFVDGASYHYGAFQSSDHFHAVLGMVARLHEVADPLATGAAADDLVVPRRDDLSTAIDELDQRWDSGPFGERARRLLARNASGVERLFVHYDRLADARRPERMVLTHGEPHPANTLRTPAGWVLVDWDTTLIAAPERDLAQMATADGSVVDAYEAATGRQVLAEALDCYRLWWDLGEICWYVTLLRQVHDDDADIRESWHNLEHYLDPAGRWPELVQNR